MIAIVAANATVTVCGRLRWCCHCIFLLLVSAVLLAFGLLFLLPSRLLRSISLILFLICCFFTGKAANNVISRAAANTFVVSIATEVDGACADISVAATAFAAAVVIVANSIVPVVTAVAAIATVAATTPLLLNIVKPLIKNLFKKLTKRKEEK